MEKIAVLIPCYNEEMTIGKVIDDFKRELPKSSIYVFDNNSGDKTYEIAEEHGAIVKTEFRQGKGNAVRSMFQEIDADIYIMVDGDDTYEASDVHKLIDKIHKGADMAIGDRLSTTYFEENKKVLHGFGNKLVRWMVNLFYGSKVEDVMTGYRAFSKKFVRSFPAKSEGFELETEMTIFALENNLIISSVPIGYRDRPEGSKSKVKAIRDGFKIIMFILASVLTYKKYVPIALIALLFGILSLFVESYRVPIIISLVLFIVAILCRN